ncbi:early E4 protein [Bat mastadenovirus]|nr:early E4 protein [Bat mastadenovirus]
MATSGDAAAAALPPPLAPLTVDQSCLDLGNDEHPIGRVKGCRFAICFVPYLEFPLPWDLFLCPRERYYLRLYFRTCSATLTIDEHKSNCYHGHEIWDLHCHCLKPGSLQCQAGGKLLRSVARAAVRGTFYNAYFSFYRATANYHQLRAVRYVGSTFISGTHLIYLHLNRESDMKFISGSWLGPHRVVDCTLNTWIILQCKSCQLLTERQARVCARRTRRIIKRCCEAIGRHRPKSLKLNYMEPLRQKMFTRLYRYRIAFNHEDYVLTV